MGDFCDADSALSEFMPSPVSEEVTEREGQSGRCSEGQTCWEPYCFLRGSP